MADESVVGSIVSLWRYPVKSMMGEELNATEVKESGLLGDRAYALVDAETGKIVSAKLPCCAQFANPGENYLARWGNRHG